MNKQSYTKKSQTKRDPFGRTAADRALTRGRILDRSVAEVITAALRHHATGDMPEALGMKDYPARIFGGLDERGRVIFSGTNEDGSELLNHEIAEVAQAYWSEEDQDAVLELSAKLESLLYMRVIQALWRQG